MKSLGRVVLIKRSVVDSILTYAKIFHPREGVLLLRGKVDKQRIVVNDVVIPPLADHGYEFSSFPLHTLPTDFSIVGTAHSHPSGVLRPSIGDLNNFYGRIMVIAAYPYRTEQDVALFDREGNQAIYQIVDSDKFE